MRERGKGREGKGKGEGEWKGGKGGEGMERREREGRGDPAIFLSHFKHWLSRAFGNSRCDYFEHAVNARDRDCDPLDLYAGITLFTCGRMKVVRKCFIWLVRSCVYLRRKIQ